MADGDRAKQLELLMALFVTGQSFSQLKYFLCINLVALYECFELTTNKIVSNVVYSWEINNNLVKVSCAQDPVN